MLFDMLRGTIDKIDIAMMLLSIPVVLISLSFHELAHGFIAYKLGDSTAKWQGRLTMNPLKHLDLMGSISMLFFGIGWAKPVQINPANFDNPKKGMALTGLAGPVSNLLLSFVSLVLYRILALVTELKFVLDGSMIYYVTNVKYGILDFIGLFLIILTMMNITLAVFNLIPVPPFDGSRIFYFLLPDKYYFGVMRYERQIMLITLLALFSGVLDVPISLVTDGVLNLFNFVVGLVL